MSDNPAHEVISDLLSHLESMETQNAAVVQLLKKKGIITDQELAPHLEQSGTAAGIKWRAARMRMEHLFAASEQVPKAETIAAKAENQSKALENDKKMESRDDKEPAKASGEKPASSKDQPVKDAAAKSSPGHDSQPKANPPQLETSAPAENTDQEQHRKAS